MVGQSSAFALTLSHDKVIPSELIQYVIPRFSLKTRIRLDRVEAAGDIQFVTEPPENGTQVLDLVSGETVYIRAVGEAAQSTDYKAFVDWLVSEPGRATIADFQIDGRQVAIPAEAQEAAPVEIVIVGDLDHSRVTSSFVEGVSNFSFNSLTFCGHPSMSTKYTNPVLGRYEPDLDTALHDADVVMTLRIQYERFEETLDLDLDEYKQAYQLTSEKLEQAKGDAIIMHPGPVNYVEISESVYQSEQSVIRSQIANGVAIRMAVLSRFLSS